MRKYKNQIDERIKAFVIQVIKTTRILPEKPEFKVIKYQIIKSASSVGANYREAQSAQSPNDNIHKLTIALKEISETSYWLELLESLIQESRSKNVTIGKLLNESIQLEKILASIRNKKLLKNKQH